jgi:negative regulator of replication initiation
MLSFLCQHVGMIRTQIQIEESVYSELKSTAASLGCSISELIRRSIHATLPAQKTKPRMIRSFKAVGRYKSGLKDLSLKHDQYLPDEW